ncbi:metallophosphoesterase family protein [Halobacteriaceae archaeon GCM10025711]
MTRLAILADTHVPSREPAVPAWVETAVEAADHTIHAGDFDAKPVYESLVDLAGGNLTAVHGNLDPADLELPHVATVALDGVTFVVTHGTGPRDGYEERIVEAVRGETTDPDAVGVGGHTHEVLDAEVDGTRILNPGSATGAEPASEPTMLVADVTDGDLSVEVRRE